MSSSKRQVGEDGNDNLIASQEKKPAKNLVHWFRKGLRLHDQPALVEGEST